MLRSRPSSATTSVWIGVIRLIEEEGFLRTVGHLLKRPDEKYVTERAYDNPKFVEDLVRDVGCSPERASRNRALTASRAENFESIHNHSAYAVVEG